MKKLYSINMINTKHMYLPQDHVDQILRFSKNTLYDFWSVMDGYYHSATDDFLKSNSSTYVTLTASENVFMYEKLNNDRPECETGLEEDETERSQDNDSQTSTPSCVSKMDYTLPKYRNNISPAIDKLMRMMNMPSLITDSSGDLPSSTNRISLPDKENFAVPIMAREYLDICFSSPKPFVSTYKREGSAENHAQSRAKEIDPLLSQIGQELMSGWQETVQLPNGEPIVASPRYEVKEMPP